jgi:hypothetical protein
VVPSGRISARPTGSYDAATVSSAQASNRVSESPRRLNGLTFARVASQVRMDEGGLRLDYEHWLAVNRGFAWQIVFWCDSKSSGLATQARSVMDTFALIDPSRDGGTDKPARDVSRPSYGYRTKIQDLGWQLGEATEGSELVDFSAQRLREALQVIPLRFDREPPDLDAITRALLSTLDFHHTPDEEMEIKPWDPGHGGTGREILVEREVEGTRYGYILRVARGTDSAHLLAGWAEVPKGDMELVRRSLDAITLQAPSLPPITLVTEKKKEFGLLLNQAGISLTDRDENERAAEWFYRGFEMSDDPDGWRPHCWRP